MERLFYSTGQVANQLGATVATVRLLCENRLIAAEITPGGQWRVPASEVERLKRDGLPPIPRPLPMQASTEEDASEPMVPSVAVVTAQDDVAITRSTLEKRRIDREIEENEDWFRERQRRQAAAAALERQRAKAKMVEHQRRLSKQRWTQYALDSVPQDARNEVAIEVHAAVAAALSEVQGDEPQAIIRPLVDAAVHRALRPWERKQDVQRALKSAMSCLPLQVQISSEWAGLKELAWKAAGESVGKVSEEASYREMAAAAEQATQPVIRAYQRWQAIERMVAWIHISDATADEQEAAKQAVREALLGLPLDATQRELEKAKETALAPFKAAVAQRKEAARRETEKQTKRRAAEWKVDPQLNHIQRYLEQEYEFQGGYSDLRTEANRLRPLIRASLIDDLLKNPSMSDAEIRTRIEGFIENEE